MEYFSMDRVRVSIPAVTIQQAPAPSASSNRRLSQVTLSPVENQCIAHHEAIDAWPDGHLNQWFSEGWRLVQTVRRGPHEFFYVRRLRSDIRNQAG
jgi:hypothetical protein